MTQAVFSQVLVGIMIAAASSWITVRLSLGRFRKEKWWERKVQTYERIIEALHVCKADAEAYLDASYEGRDLPNDQETKKRTRAAHTELAKAIDVGGFILSEQAHERLLRYRMESREAEKNEDVHMYVEHDLSATASCLDDLIRIAKKDLQTRQ